MNIDNFIRGTRDADTLTGSQDNDRLFGHFGSDVLIGGNGEDRFILAKGDGTHDVFDMSDTDDARDVIVLRLDNTERSLFAIAQAFSSEDRIRIIGGTDQLTVQTFTNRLGHTNLFISDYTTGLSHVVQFENLADAEFITDRIII